MSQLILGIDLGTHTLKTILLERHFQDFEVLKFVEQPLHQHTRLSHAEAVALALEQIVQAHPEMLKADVVSAALPGHFVSERLLEMPVPNLSKLKQMVEFELEGHIPGEIENLFVDSHVIERSPELSKVLALYFPEERLAQYLDVLGRVGLDPKYFGSDLIDLSGIAQVGLFPRAGHYAICDIGHSKTNVCLMEGTELRYARTIGIGGLHFTKAIQRVFNLNYEKAESLKLSRGKIVTRVAEADQVSRLLTDVAQELVSNIKQTFIGFDGFFGKETKAAIYGTGGGMKLAGLSEYLSFHLRSNVLEIDPLSLLNHRLADPEDKLLFMSQAMGSAIRPIFSNRLPRVNFRKGAYAFKQDIQKITDELKTAGIFLAVIVLLGIGYYFYAEAYFAGRIASLEKKVSQLITTEFPDFGGTTGRPQKVAKGALERYLKSAKSKLATIKSQVESVSGGSGATPLEIMQEISAKLPPKNEVVFELSEFNYSDDFVRLKARTNDPRNPAKIVESLRESTLFSQIETTDPQQKPNDVYDFVVKVDLKKE